MRREIFERIRRKKRKQLMTLQLTSLMDVLIIIVVFLLKSYGVSSMNISATDKVTLPVSKAPEVVGEGTPLIIARDKIVLNDKPIVNFIGDPEARKFEIPNDAKDFRSQGKGILPLYDALIKQKEDYELLASRSQDPKKAQAKWSGNLMVQADKDIPYDILRSVMYTAGVAGYKVFRLTVMKLAQ